MTEYTGHIEAGGGPVERRDGPLIVRKLSVGDMDNNVYIVANANGGAAYVIDAAAEPDRIKEAADDFEPIAVLQTHGHWDHVRAWHDLPWPKWGHPGDVAEGMFPEEPARALSHGDSLPLGDSLEVRVIHTPGHTPGSLHYLVEGASRPHLFTGDSLFPGGPGNTWNDEEKFTQLMDGLEREIFGRLPGETWVYPGHGDDTTLGDERPKIPEWRERGW